VEAAQACRRIAKVDLGDFDGDAVASALKQVQAARSALTAARARLAAAATKLAAHEQDGASDTAAWMRDKLGVSARDARSAAELGRDLETLPGTEAALAEGRIGEEQAGAIARAARRGALGDGAATEQRLLDAAEEQTPEQLARTIARAEQEADGDSLARDERRARARRRCNITDRPDGMVELYALLDRPSAEVVRSAIGAFQTQDPADTPIMERRRPEQRRADALVAAARAALDGGTAPTNGGVRPHVSVVINLEALGNRAGAGGVTGTGQLISTEAVRRIICDADVTRIIMAGPSQVLDVGRATRAWSSAQRRAVIARDGACRGPGCDRPASWCDVHHVAWWDRDQGPTSVDNGLLLCHTHHDAVHNGGWTVEVDPDSAVATWTSRTGRVVTTGPHAVAGRSTGGPGRRPS
jgi:hypothetical protein